MNNHVNFGGDQDDISEITDIQFGDEQFVEEENSKSNQLLYVDLLDHDDNQYATNKFA